MTATVAPRSFLDAQGILAARLPAYTRRPAQEELAAAIEAALASDGRLLAQAGTGIGKSLAALIPVILSGRRMIVATSTKALQNQYSSKDLPFLDEVLGGFTWAVLKGRSNYACQAKISELEMPTTQQAALLNVLDEADRAGADHDGDRENLPTVTNGEWAQLSISAAECPGKKDCPFAEQCYAERAKDKAEEARLVITNTAYLAQDLVIRASSDALVKLLGDYHGLVIDEAHNLEPVITGALSDSIGRRALERLGRDADGYLAMERALPDDAAAFTPGQCITAATADLWASLEAVYSAHMRELRGKADPMRLTQGQIIKTFQDEVLALTRALGTLRNAIDATHPGDDKGVLARKRLLRRIDDWTSRIRYYMITEDDKIARWLEQETETVRGEQQTRLYLRSAPISVAPFLRTALWGQDIPVVLMSATLTTQRGSDAFQFVRQALGLEAGEATEFDAGSPFDYGSQAMLYIPEKSVPAPSGPTQAAWRNFSQEVAQALVEAARGGALLLFTSRSAMEDAHRRLAPTFRRAGLTVLKQGDAPNSVLGAQFREDEDSVLFALRSFFEGIDVQGRALRLVVLDKLPFSVPTDILHAARCDAIDRRYGKSASFRRMVMPEMTLILIQAAGRLIRHINDRGVIAVLDSRLTSKSYGKQILDSMPPMPITTDVHKAIQFLEQLQSA